MGHKIADDFGLTEEERNQLLPSGRQKLLYNRIHWAKFFLSKAGLIDTPRRGRFIISDAGRELLAKNPSRVDNDLLDEYPAFREFREAPPSSHKFVNHISQRIVLIDGQRLADLMIEHNVGVRPNRTIEFKRLDEDFFSEED